MIKELDSLKAFLLGENVAAAGSYVYTPSFDELKAVFKASLPAADRYV